MTRINLVAPETLSRNHLIAEYRELPSIFGRVLKAQDRGNTAESVKERAPSSYVLGAGHVLFFYTRLTWLNARFLSLVAEMHKRGYEPTYVDLESKMQHLRTEWFKDQWTPSPEEVAISQARIDERLTQRMTYKHKPGQTKSGLSQRQEWDFF